MPRPRKSFNGFRGQHDIVRLLKRQLAGAQRQAKPAPHTLLLGGPGRGKSHLSQAIGVEMGCDLHELHGPCCSVANLVDVLQKAGTNDVILIDESHGLSASAQELISQVMSTSTMRVRNGDNQQQEVEIKPVSFVFASDRTDRLADACTKRFELRLRLSLYDETTLKEICDELAAREDIRITGQASRMIASIGRGLPRQVEHHLRNVARHRDVAGEIKTEDVVRYKHDAGIDDLGLNQTDHEYLRLLRRNGRLGLGAIAAQLKLGPRFVVHEVEDWLFHLGLARIKAGRVITERGLWWLNNFNKPQDKREPDPGIHGDTQ